MALERTLAIIKPEAVVYRDEILLAYRQAGFLIVEMKVGRLTEEEAKIFAIEHVAHEAYPRIWAHFSSGEILVLLLEQDDAIGKCRLLHGCNDPAKAALGTLRAKYGNGKKANAVHSAKDTKEAAREIAFFFGKNKVVNW